MVITITSDKGGVGKTTTTIHLANILALSRPTLVIDADKNRTALNWANRAAASSQPFNFQVIPQGQLVAVAADYPPKSSHLIIDTAGRPNDADLEDAVKTSDLIIVPTEADTASIETLADLLQKIKAFMGNRTNKRLGILITNVPPLPQRDGRYAREIVQTYGFPVFNTAMRSYKCYRTAQTRGVTVECVREDPRSVSAWADCMAFAAEVDMPGQSGAQYA